MPHALQFHAASGSLHRDGQAFDPWQLSWSTGSTPAGCDPVAPSEALARLAAQRRLRRVPVGIIGPRSASAEEANVAEHLGNELTRIGLQVMCGGKAGVMEAACRGALAAGGQPLGLLPDNAWTQANPHVAIPIATGLGPARNAVIARACLVLVAVGGGYGTLSEIAFGLQFERLVLGLGQVPPVPGTVICTSVDDAVERVALRFLGLA